MSQSLVSVIIPAYNAAPYIGAAIESVIDQTYPHWELWVIDDGSTDNTSAVVERYLSDERVHYVYQENQERCVARNHGIRRATGHYIAFLDADDVWLPDKLNLQVAYLDAHPDVGLCFTQYKRMGRPDGPAAPVNFEPEKDPFYALLTAKTNIAPSTAVIRAEVFAKAGLFDETLAICMGEDLDLWLRIVRHYPIAWIKRPLVLYRSGGNTSREKARPGLERILDKVFADPQLPPRIAQRKPRVYAHYYFRFSRHDLDLQHRYAAFKQWRRAVKTYPLGIVLLPEGRKATLELCLPFGVRVGLHRLRKRLRGANTRNRDITTSRKT